MGNPFGNVPVVWPNLNQDKYPIYNNGIGAPNTPAIFIDPHNRPGRVFTWSIGVQREVMRDLVVEISYVGNRGAYFPAPHMNQIAQNTVTPAFLKARIRNRHEQRHRPGAADPADQQRGGSGPFPPISRSSP